MYAALNEHEVLVYAIEAANQSSSQYHCPKCLTKVSLKISKKGNYYFAHLKRCSSSTNQKQLSGESALHQRGKHLLARTSDTAQIEKWLPSINQQVDCWVEIRGCAPYILEFQNSVISSESLRQRQTAYLTISPHVFWLNHHNAWNQQRVSKWQKDMLHYSNKIGFYWLGMDLVAEHIVIYYQLPILFASHQWSCQQATIPIGNDWLRQLINLIGNEDDQKALSHPFKMQNEHPATSIKSALRGDFCHSAKLIFNSKGAKFHSAPTLKNALRQSATYRPFLLWLAKKGVTIDQLPDWIFTIRWQCLLVEMPSWMLLSSVWIHFSGVARQQVTYEAVRAILGQLSEERWFILSSLPLIGKQPLDELSVAITKCLQYYHNQ